MHSKIFSVFALALFSHIAFAQTNTVPVTGTLGNATVVENNPPGILYTATLPNSSFFNPEDPRGNIKGSGMQHTLCGMGTRLKFCMLSSFSSLLSLYPFSTPDLTVTNYL